MFAILIIKQLFGGLGQNFMNPALGARCFLLISFTGPMTKFIYDGMTGPTPLAALKAGESVNTMDMLLGTIPGTIGETSVIAIIIGAIFPDLNRSYRSSHPGYLYCNICDLCWYLRTVYRCTGGTFRSTVHHCTSVWRRTDAWSMVYGD